MTPYEELKDICRQLNDARTYWCILRMPRNYKHGEYEVDIACRSDLINEFSTVLEREGFNKFQNENKSHIHFMRKDLHLDMVSDLSFGLEDQHSIGSADNLIKNRRLEDDLYYMSYEDDVIFVFLHALWDKDNLVAYESHIMGTKRRCDERFMINAIGALIAHKKKSQASNMLGG